MGGLQILDTESDLLQMRKLLRHPERMAMEVNLVEIAFFAEV